MKIQLRPEFCEKVFFHKINFFLWFDKIENVIHPQKTIIIIWMFTAYLVALKSTNPIDLMRCILSIQARNIFVFLSNFSTRIFYTCLKTWKLYNNAHIPMQRNSRWSVSPVTKAESNCNRYQADVKMYFMIARVKVYICMRKKCTCDKSASA